MTDETAPALDFDPVPTLATTLGIPPGAIAAVLAMLDEGSTVPFIARYRKERTGGLDEVQLRAIEERRTYVVELETRRAAILASVAEQGKLTPELEAKLRGAEGKSELEDLYAPYRPRRKTRASVAREKGLEPLADKIRAQGADGDPAVEAAAFITEGVATAEDALAGARDIVAELIADTAEVRAFVRREYAEQGELVSTVVPGKGDEPTKFEQYYQFSEAVKTIPSHRFLAIRRGEAEGVLRAQVVVDPNKVGVGIERLVHLDASSPWAQQLHLSIADALKRLLGPSVENDVRAELKQRSDLAAVDIFAGNLRNLMLAAPLGSAAVIGVDPGLRTGCKCAAIDATGKFLGTVTVYITQGDAQLANAKEDFLAFVQKFKPRAIAVGNGTGGREAEQFVKKVLGDAGLREGPDAPFVVQVNEAGASVYSASDLAREEFPELDLTIRGAISIARRLQDPLAELVKIEPKSIGVGQYQHDVNQPLIAKRLGDVVEDCVNKVGVELNTASAMLLGYVAGIGKSLAKKIVVHRDTHGAFSARAQLTDVSGLGPKAFEQAAGFLRIANAPHPLDRSAVHPERYPLVEKIAADLGVELPALIGNQELVDKIDLSAYVSGDVGEPTLRDIVAELAKPGRDPRAEFSPPSFRDDVTSMEDLKPGMVLEGIVTNVTAFGAFVDIGVHNDGLVHVSQLSEQFVKDPAEVVKVGQKLTVRVLEVDNARKRIGLSAKRGGQQAPRPQQQQQMPRADGQPPQNRRGGRGRGGGGGPRPDGQQGAQQRGPNQGGGGQWQGGSNQGGPNQGGPNQGGPNQGDARGPNQGGSWQGEGRGRGRGRGPRSDQGAPHGGPDQQAGAPNQGDLNQGGANQGGANQGDARGPNQSGPWQGEGRGRGRGRGPQIDQGAPHGGPDQQAGSPNQGDLFQGGANQGGANQGERRQWRDRPQAQGDQPQGDRPQGDQGAEQSSSRGDASQGRPNQGGPNQGGPPWRGDPHQGPNQGGQAWRGDPNRGPRGPRTDRGPGGPGGGPRRDDRGPGGPGGQGQRTDRGPGGPGGGPRRDDRGPQGGFPRRDDRGPQGGFPRDDEQRREKPPENWGVGGFKNNPFAKLVEKPKR